jgi:hypothetical protein
MEYNPIIIMSMKAGTRKATLIFHQKLSLPRGFITERKIWKVPSSERYPNGIKYRLVLVDPKSRNVLLLFDNHWPKGPHIHWDDKERSYVFENFEQLIKDFIQESEVEEKRYHENKKNSD